LATNYVKNAEKNSQNETEVRNLEENKTSGTEVKN